MTNRLLLSLALASLLAGCTNDYSSFRFVPGESDPGGAGGTGNAASAGAAPAGAGAGGGP